MSTGLMPQNASALSTRSNAFGENEITMPQIGALAEQQRSEAEIKGMIAVSKMYPRDEVGAIEKIKTAFQRSGLAESAEYCYDKGGSEITGPTIDTLTTVANYWGNINFGVRFLAQNADNTTVQCFAWDSENIVKRDLTIIVPHSMKARGAIKKLTDPRDIYEHVANMAARRMRKCLEDVIPSDVVEIALETARETLKTTAEVNDVTIKKLLDAFSKFSVTRELIEKRLGRKIESMQPAQYVKMRQIYKSISDGISSPESWFDMPMDETAATDTSKASIKERLKAKAAKPAEQPADDLAAEAYAKEATSGNLFDKGHEAHD
jgi:hypothetical protein